MKKKLQILLASSLIIMCSHSIAQPTLTASGINSVIGEVVSTKNTTYVNPGSPGANKTWDLSSATVTGTGTTTVVSPSSTPNGSSFPNANIAYSAAGQGVSYYKTSSTAMQYYGSVTTAATMPYSNPEDFLRYPFTYNNTFSDSWAAQFISTGYTFYRTGTTTVTADGYGTLITPAGTYTNVLRVHYVQNYQDSTNTGMPYIITYVNDQYVWYKDGIHSPIATVYSTVPSVGAPYTGGSYQSAVSGINNLSDIITSSNLYPNPASDKINIDISLNGNAKTEVILFNSTGQKINTNQMQDALQGKNTMQFNLENLPQGIYFARILLNGNIVSEKRFIIAR